MTCPDGNPLNSTQWLHDLAPGEISKLPEHASQFVREHTVVVKSAARVFASHQQRRENEVRLLVQHYIQQLRYGCREPTCSTPSCHTFRKRISQGPYRRPTELTATSIAFSLATNDDPRAALCPHPLRSSLADDGHDAGRSTANTTEAATQTVPRMSFTEHVTVAETSTSGARASSRSGAVNHEPSREPDAVLSGAGSSTAQHVPHVHSVNDMISESKIDPKSITQRLFRTVAAKTWLMSSWVGPLRSGPKSEPEAANDSAVSDSVPVEYESVVPHVTDDGVVASSTASVPGRVSDLSLSAGDHVGSTVLSDACNGDTSSSPSKIGASALNRETAGVEHARSFPQSLSILTYELMEELKTLHPSRESQKEAVGQDSNRKYSSDASIFIDQSLFYVFSNPPMLLKSFVTMRTTENGHPLSTSMESAQLDSAFRSWDSGSQSTFMNALWSCLESLFTVPPELVAQKSPHLRSVQGFSNGVTVYARAGSHAYLSDMQALHIIKICIHALAGIVDKATPSAWLGLHKLRAQGYTYREPSAPLIPAMDIIDQFEHEFAKRLTMRLAKAIGARRCFAESMNIVLRKKSRRSDFNALVMRYLVAAHSLEQNTSASSMKDVREPAQFSQNHDQGWIVVGVFLEWMRGALLQSWDGKTQVKRWSVAGSAIEIFADLFNHRDRLGLASELFQTPILTWKLEPTEILAEWLKHTYNCNHLHLLSYPFLFPPSTLVQYFRAFNYSAMSKACEKVWNNFSLRHSLASMLDERRQAYLSSRLMPITSQYLWLNVARDTVLVDSLNQLWRRERRELKRPLKVRLGKEMSEEGADLGGVSQEFFRMAFAEALHPDHGLFVIEDQSGRTSFQPRSLEPAYKFELLGLLAGLALYNGVVIPLNFPITMYRKLLGLPVRAPAHIEDGWPQHAKALREILQCEDVSNYALSYVFSYDAFGQRVEVDMTDGDQKVERSLKKKGKERMMSSNLKDASFRNMGEGSIMRSKFEKGESSEEATRPHNVQSESVKAALSDDGLRNPLDDANQSKSVAEPQWSESVTVTNANRHAYVRDYIAHLTHHSVAPQYSAFERGFYTVVSRRAASIFYPENFRTLVEGLPVLDLKELRRVTQYIDAESANGYTSEEHPAIQWFWKIVEGWEEQKRRALLEFVTSSDRVPGGGYDMLVFVISRNGGDTDRLPTSSTCFGRLLLPEYEREEKMRVKLETAIENAKGFGMV